MFFYFVLLHGAKLILISFSACCSESTSGPYYLRTEEGGVAHTYCHMEDIAGCGGGGWTLVMKIDGKKVDEAKISHYLLFLSNKKNI